MQALAARELLEVWEQGMALAPARRAVLLLTAACPEAAPEEVEQWSIGERDARLLTLRAWTFGGRLEGIAACPHCGERVELALEVAELLKAAPSPGHGGAAPTGEEGPVLGIRQENGELRFRLPNSRDLLAIEGEADEAAAARLLLDRCLAPYREPGAPLSATDLAPEAARTIMAHMAQADPLADIRVALSCPGCQDFWELPLDIVSFFWKEIDAWAHRLLRQVHVLAAAYGWRERDILTMSAWRRHYYLSLLGG